MALENLDEQLEANIKEIIKTIKNVVLRLIHIQMGRERLESGEMM